MYAESDSDVEEISSDDNDSDSVVRHDVVRINCKGVFGQLLTVV